MRYCDAQRAAVSLYAAEHGTLVHLDADRRESSARRNSAERKSLTAAKVWKLLLVGTGFQAQPTSQHIAVLRSGGREQRAIGRMYCQHISKSLQTARSFRVCFGFLQTGIACSTCGLSFLMTAAGSFDGEVHLSLGTILLLNPAAVVLVPGTQAQPSDVASCQQDILFRCWRGERTSFL